MVPSVVAMKRRNPRPARTQGEYRPRPFDFFLTRFDGEPIELGNVDRLLEITSRIRERLDELGLAGEGELIEHVGFPLPESLLALDVEDPGHIRARALLDDVVRVRAVSEE